MGGEEELDEEVVAGAEDVGAGAAGGDAADDTESEALLVAGGVEDTAAADPAGGEAASMPAASARKTRVSAPGPEKLAPPFQCSMCSGRLLLLCALLTLHAAGTLIRRHNRHYQLSSRARLELDYWRHSVNFRRICLEVDSLQMQMVEG